MSEQKIEQELIEKLGDLKYGHRPDIRDRVALEKNFREKFEELNQVRLTDHEFKRLLDAVVTQDVFAAAQRLRELSSFERDDGTKLIYALINVKDWCKNAFEVVSQLRINTDNSHRRYDVILLVSGVPVVQIELKTLAVSPRRAMQQVVDYKNDPGSGYGKTLLCFLQLFVVSNRSDTWYFANNNSSHFSFDADERFLPLYQFAGEDNRKIVRLDQFADKFLAKRTLVEMISRYMVLVASEQRLLAMRPYQIHAVKAIVECIHQNCGNGYVWHTTGSGKTLTAFKAATLLKDDPKIDKCLFVVDRKDLDRQTREEFNKFQKNCVEENTNTESLVQRLLSSDYADKVIVATIQKLGLALDGSCKRNYKERLEPLRSRRIAFIFDECHRSQFGENHKAIREFFPKAQLFGFTGTPIFEENAACRQIEGQRASSRTTEDLFQQQLHAYTITHAIEDRNVLRFHVEYYKPEGRNAPRPGEALAKKAIVEAILEKHDAATVGRRFNAILATASIDDAIAYYELFKTMQAERKARDSKFKPLNIACAFTPPAEGNKDVQQIQEDLPQERADNEQAPEAKKAALKAIIADYNARYGTSHGISEFDLYYQDVQQRIKSQQYPDHDLPHAKKIDVAIVVDMLLTGFDSKYLNTLYVDKNLRSHGLIQAFSRTNRVLNDTKPAGNILDFRQQQDAVDDAIALFSGEQVDRAKEIWLVDPAPAVVAKLKTSVGNLKDFMRSQGLEGVPEAVPNLKGDAARSQFVNLFKEVQRLKVQLDQYTDLTPEDAGSMERIISKEQLQGFRGVYLETARRLKARRDKGGDAAGPEVQQLDFELVLFASTVIDYDYIMELLARYTQERPSRRKTSRAQLIGLIQSDAKFVDEREEIAAYIDTLQAGTGLDEKAVREGYETFKAERNSRELAGIAARHGLEAGTLQAFADAILRRMIFDGEQLTDLFAPLELGWKARAQKERALVKELGPLLRKLAHGGEIAGLDAYEQ